MAQSRTEVLEPADAEELLRGWLLHVHKARDRHERCARHAESRRYLFGGVAVVLSAASGSTVFASIGGSPPEAVVLLVGAISILAAVSAALQTFLDYPGRATRHHVAAVKYKGIIRELEQALTGPVAEQTQSATPDATPGAGIRDLPSESTVTSALGPGGLEPLPAPEPGEGFPQPAPGAPRPHDPVWITELRARLDALEEATPVVDEKTWKGVNNDYTNSYLVPKAIRFKDEPPRTT